MGVLLVGCGVSQPRVWVDLDRAILLTPETKAAAVSLPKPPPGMPAKSFVLPGRSREVVGSAASPGVAKPRQAATEIQDRSLRTLRERLLRVYMRQADLYQRQQETLTGDLNKKALTALTPRLREAFEEYARRRMPLITRLVFLVGFPDSNPTSAPPPEGLQPVPKRRWLEGNELRSQIAALDLAYSKQVADFLSEIAHMAAEDRLALLKKVDDYRRQLMDQALKEAVNPMKSGTPLTLRLSGSSAVELPPVPDQKLDLPAAPAPSPAPQVESERAFYEREQSRRLMGKQLQIWLALQGKALAPQSGRGIPDETQEFVDWIRRQRAGL
ncbi:MAG TPA: hypothetical protein VG944_04545 [Fimbriimonas sp.]|nr:hypothetical protein [Fimbriimonas sp.]